MSIRLIAEHFGVSSSTVSLALRGSHRVAAKTRLKIQSFAKAHDYVPNPQISQMLSQVRRNPDKVDTLSFAYLSSYAEKNRDHGIYNLYLEGCRQEACKLGYAFEHFDLQRDGMSARRLQDILLARGIERVLLAPGFAEDGFPQIEVERFKCIAFGFSFPHTFVTRIAFDFFRSTLVAMQKLHDRGYRRLGFVFPDGYSERFQHRWDGAYFTFLALHEDQECLPMFTLSHRPEAFEAWIKEWKPDVVIEGTPSYLSTLLERGYCLGQDIGYMSLTLDYLDRPQYQARFPRLTGKIPQISGVRENCLYTAQRAVRSLAGPSFAEDSTEAMRPEVILIEGTWVEGETIRACGV